MAYSVYNLNNRINNLQSQINNGGASGDASLAGNNIFTGQNTFNNAFQASGANVYLGNGTTATAISLQSKTGVIGINSNPLNTGEVDIGNINTITKIVGNVDIAKTFGDTVNIGSGTNIINVSGSQVNLGNTTSITQVKGDQVTLDGAITSVYGNDVNVGNDAGASQIYIGDSTSTTTFKGDLRIGETQNILIKTAGNLTMDAPTIYLGDNTTLTNQNITIGNTTSTSTLEGTNNIGSSTSTTTVYNDLLVQGDTSAFKVENSSGQLELNLNGTQGNVNEVITKRLDGAKWYALGLPEILENNGTVDNSSATFTAGIFAENIISGLGYSYRSKDALGNTTGLLEMTTGIDINVGDLQGALTANQLRMTNGSPEITAGQMTLNDKSLSFFYFEYFICLS